MATSRYTNPLASTEGVAEYVTNRSAISLSVINITVAQYCVNICVKKASKICTVHPNARSMSLQTTHSSNIDLMIPDLLLCSRRKGAHTQDVLHLSIGNKHDVSRHEPSQALGARRAGEAAAICPEVIESVTRFNQLMNKLHCCCLVTYLLISSSARLTFSGVPGALFDVSLKPM